jgi:hypothetical protein
VKGPGFTEIRVGGWKCDGRFQKVIRKNLPKLGEGMLVPFLQTWLALYLLCLLLVAAEPTTTVTSLLQPIVIDVARDYGNISFQSIGRAMERAQQVVASPSNASIVIFLQAGSHTVDMADGHLFDVSGIVSKAGQRLIVAGAGMDDTMLVTRTHGNDVIHAHRRMGGPMWRGVRFENMTFAREGQTTTQGRLIAVDDSAHGGGIDLEVS